MWAYPEIRTLGDVPSFYARRDPERIALRFENHMFTYAALDTSARNVCAMLLGRGVGPGDRVGFFGRNSPGFYAALFGTARTRACFMPINWRLSVPELAALLLDSALRIAIVDRGVEQPLLAAAASAGVEIDLLFVDEIEAGSVSSPVEPVVSEEDAALQLYTSGTTGKPKGVVMSHGGFNRMRLSEHLEPAFDWQEGDSFLNPLPNFHLLHLGIAMQCLYSGVSVTILPQFDPADVLSALQRTRATLLTLTPTMLQMLLDHPAATDTDFSSLRLCLYAGSPVSLGLITRAMASMPCGFMQFYGATEAGGAFSILRPSEHDLSNEQRLQSCGRPLPLIEFAIRDEDGNDILDDQPGELWIRSPAIMAGYFHQPEATAAALVYGWYRSGDVARRDEEGFYYLVDRLKDMIVSGGENIYSAEIENALSTHDAVASVAVVGVPDARWGEAVKAIVVLREGRRCSEGELVEHCRKRLASYKVPKSVDFVLSLPLLPSGKISKKDLRAIYWGTSGRAVA